MSLFHDFIERERPFVFIGPPGSGKTVFFNCAIDLVQRLLNRSYSNRKLYTSDEPTERRQALALKELRNGKWPQNTQGKVEYSYTLSTDYGFLPYFTLFTFHSPLIYHDFPGETFDAAFHDDHNELKDVTKLHDSLRTARGIFLIIDTPKLHDRDDDKYRLRLGRLLSFLNDSTARRVAVIFTKRDYFAGDPNFDPSDHFQARFPNTWTRLNSDGITSKWFFVSAVPNPAIGDEGKPVPPKNFDPTQSIGILEPLTWMLRLPQ